MNTAKIKMKEIRYTLGDSPLWHSLYIEHELSREVCDDILFANIITQELHKMGIEEPVKKFKLLDSNQKEIAYSNDLSEYCKLTYTDNETDNS